VSQYCVEDTVLVFVNQEHDEGATGELTCHTNGTFFRFATMTRKARIRDLLPGPVNMPASKALALTREPAIVMARRDTPAIDLMGNAAAEAILQLKRRAKDCSH